MIKKSLFLFIFGISLAYSQDTQKPKADFIDDLEYGRELYENPRGISCKKCHQDKGEGGLIATYKHKGKTKELKAPPIFNLSLEKFSKAVNNAQGVMPKYSLTEQEILAIYNYLTQQKK